jgi:hypothetical protein
MAEEALASNTSYRYNVERQNQQTTVIFYILLAGHHVMILGK